MKTLLAFHNDQSIKDKYLARIRAHAAADEITNGIYWEGGKGCAVGCTIHGDRHSDYEKELGIPTVLARLEDRLFEGMFTKNPVAAKAWPERFLSAPKIGADLSMVWPKFAHWMLVDPEHGVINRAKSKRSKAAIEAVATLYARWIDGDKPDKKEWVDAAAADAAYAAAYAAADAADAADAAYARSQHYCVMADKLINLMTACE